MLIKEENEIAYISNILITHINKHTGCSFGHVESVEKSVASATKVLAFVSI